MEEEEEEEGLKGDGCYGKGGERKCVGNGKVGLVRGDWMFWKEVFVRKYVCVGGMLWMGKWGYGKRRFELLMKREVCGWYYVWISVVD